MRVELTRRRWLHLSAWSSLLGGSLLPWRADAQQVKPIVSAMRPPEPPLHFPQDEGAHLDARAEWWTLKGVLQLDGRQTLGFHIAYFRTAVESAEGNPSRFSPRHLIGARASLSDAGLGRIWHDQRMARVGFGLVDVAQDDMRVSLQDWLLARSGPTGRGVFQGRVTASEFTLDLRCTQTQTEMPHGERGTIHRDPFLGYPTRYYSQPQLKVAGRVSYQRRTTDVTGQAWLDHGWGRRMMAPDAVGADWICMNLLDGSALMVVRMRRSDGSTVWEGAGLRQKGRPDRVFKHEEISMTPGQIWRSPATGAQYPVTWRIDLAEASYTVKARMNHQEVDGGNGIGDVYWEGVSDLLDAKGQVIGTGFLEMTGYAGELLV